VGELNGCSLIGREPWALADVLGEGASVEPDARWQALATRSSRVASLGRSGALGEESDTSRA
jgi:hypothetical protein